MDGAEDVIIYNCMCVNKTNHKVTKNNDNSRKSMNLALPASVAGRECAHAQKRDEIEHIYLDVGVQEGLSYRQMYYFHFFERSTLFNFFICFYHPVLFYLLLFFKNIFFY